MFQLKLFGNPSIDRDGVLLTGRASQRHRLALLALLALAPDRRLSRDKLIAYLWPESDPERGRNLLKVATYVLRSALGESALGSNGDGLSLNPDVIRVDVNEFEAMLERDHARAVTLYKGPFLDGFFLSEAPEFEQWVDRMRERLANGYRKALEGLADAAEREQAYEKATEWWKARAAHDPYDSRVALRLMQAFEASGNRAGALQHAVIHERMLKDEFGLEPTPEIAALVERLRREPPATPSLANSRHPKDNAAAIPDAEVPDSVSDHPAAVPQSRQLDHFVEPLRALARRAGRGAWS